MIDIIKLQKICKKLNIPDVGAVPWPLPAESRHILFEANPCPFTSANINERLGESHPFTPAGAIVCIFPYHMNHTGFTNLSRYTWALDYHTVVNNYLGRLVDALKELEPDACYSIHCDTSPLADRYMAYLAGLGFYGKNRCLIHPVWGSYIVIGTVLTTASVAPNPNAPLKTGCMGCDKCITACLGRCLGTDIFHYETCKSYLTQKKGDLIDAERQIIAKTPLLFGCDVCQEVCPHNENIPNTPIPEFQIIEPILITDSLKFMTNKQFKAVYSRRAFSWRGKKILLRNEEYIKKNQLI